MSKYNGDVNEYDYDRHKNTLIDYLSIPLIQTLLNAKYTIVYVPENIDLNKLIFDKYGYSYDFKINGLCYHKYKIIYVSVDKAARVSLHEIGHAIDAISGNLSCKKEFLNIYNSDDAAGSFSADSYYRSNNLEYFAESFVHYLMYNSFQSSSSPITNNYFKGLDDIGIF